jgi:NMD protein affecting ribosome stability and mRNA decay
MLSIIIPSRKVVANCTYDDYNSNMSCSKCGNTESRIVKGLCLRCYGQLPERRTYKQKWIKSHRAHMNEKQREFYSKNADKMRERSRTFYRKHRESELDRVRFKKYGISGDRFREIIKGQNGKCPICDIILSRTLCVDHNHTTNKVRGIICNNCNFAIGNAGDSPIRLRAMADYLEKNDD